MLDRWDLIYGPQEAIPHGPNKLDVPCYVDAKDTFENVNIWLGGNYLRNFKVFAMFI